MTVRKPTLKLGEQITIRRGPKQGAKWVTVSTVTMGAPDSVIIDPLTPATSTAYDEAPAYNDAGPYDGGT